MEGYEILPYPEDTHKYNNHAVYFNLETIFRPNPM